MKHRLLVPLVLLAGTAYAEAPEQSLRPEARPAGLGGTDGTAGVLALEVRLDGSPARLLAISPLVPPLQGALLPQATREPPPTAPRQPPLIAVEPSAEPLVGPPEVVRAELLMPHSFLRVVVDGWAGDVPPGRPEAEPRPDEGPPPGRPRARPLPPLDLAALVPPEPDAAPAYAPGAGPDLLPLAPGYSPFAVAVALLPSARPGGIVERAEAARAEALRGQVCGNPLLQGEVAAPVRGGGGCGIEEPVSLRSVDGVRLSEASLMDCATAEALLQWMQEGARPAVGSRGGGIAGLQVFGHYVCRPRNNQAGARMSEHGLGRAIDIGAILLADGSSLSVARDWPDPALREMHEAACGIFSTTLGPGSDGFHEDHLHYDTARGRGPYCR